MADNGYLGNQFIYDASQQATKDWRTQEANKRRAVSAAYGLADEAANMPGVLQGAAQQGREDIMGQMGQAYGTAAGGMNYAPTGGAMAGQMRALGAEQGRQFAGFGADMAQRVQQSKQDALAQEWESAKAVATMPTQTQQTQAELDTWMTIYDQVWNDPTIPSDQKRQILEWVGATMSPAARQGIAPMIERETPSERIRSDMDFYYGRFHHDD